MPALHTGAHEIWENDHGMLFEGQGALVHLHHTVDFADKPEAREETNGTC